MEPSPREGMEVRGLTGRAQVANGVYWYTAEWQDKRRVYVQEGKAATHAHRLRFDDGHSTRAPPAWIIERPMEAGKCWAYAEDAAQAPHLLRVPWNVYVCAANVPLSNGEFHAAPAGFQIELVVEPPPPPPHRTESRTGSRTPPLRPQSAPTPPPRSIRIEGHRYMEFNGVYTEQGVNAGHPRYVNNAGKHLFRPDTWAQWSISPHFTPASDSCSGYIETAGGVPLGRSVWKVLNASTTTFEDCVLTWYAPSARPPRACPPYAHLLLCLLALAAGARWLGRSCLY
jgi:hypothetical protein